MCGIAGILGDKAANPKVLGAMIGALSYRGPDDIGTWTDREAGIALGHRRLSIVDLSLAGHQPMQSANGRFVLTFNGEIYNFEELRVALEADGAVPEGGWRGHSDTEVFLEAIACWGLEPTLVRSAGMFSQSPPTSKRSPISSTSAIPAAVRTTECCEACAKPGPPDGFRPVRDMLEALEYAPAENAAKISQ